VIPFGLVDTSLSERQAAFDARRVRFLECIAKGALVKSEGFEAWQAADKRVHPVPSTDPADEGQMSRYKAGLLTVCDAVSDWGLDRIDPGLEAVSERLRQLSPNAWVTQQRKRLDDPDRVAALARTMLVRAYPDRSEEFFGWAAIGSNPDAFWMPKLESLHMQYLLDTADFGANELLRILYFLGTVPPHLADAAHAWRDPAQMDRDPNFPEGGEALLKSQFLDFKYWIDDPFRCHEFGDAAKAVRANNKHENMEDGQDMTYWSENHRLLFATTEYLAGQYWPDELLVSMRRHRKGGPTAPPRPGDMTGREHMEHAKPRVLAWLNERLRLGFSEWNAPGYYVEDLLPLLNLVDLVVDPDIQNRATMVVDLLVFDIARSSLGGAFAGSAGRAYFEHKNCVWEQSIRDTAELLFGQLGHFVGSSNAAIFLATSPSYRPPDVLLAIGTNPPARYTSKSRVSIDFNEAKDYGIGFKSDDDIVFWWSRAGFATKQTVEGSLEVAERHGLMDTPPFKEVLKPIKDVGGPISSFLGREAIATGALATLGLTLGGPAGAVSGAVLGTLLGLFLPSGEEGIADLASVLTEGSVLSRANLLTHRMNDAMLSSVRDFRAGQLNFQGWPCVATVGKGAMVWTTYPSAGTTLKADISLAPVRGGIGAILGGLALGPVGGIAGYLLTAKSSSPVGEAGLKDIHIEEKLFPAHHDGPNWWTGNAVQPRVVQQRGAAIIAYQAKTIQKLMFGKRTHAWFPKAQFDETFGPEEAQQCNQDSGRWFFGRSRAGYVALFTGRTGDWANGGDWVDKEIEVDGSRNIFILQVGNAVEYGSFPEFRSRVRRARIHINGLYNDFANFECSYDVPNGARLELHYDDEDHRYGGVSLGGGGFPRSRSAFARIGWLQNRYAIRHRGHSVIHDIASGERLIAQQLAFLVHETPLTFYGQNMGLLPGPLYKGVNRDGAIAHLIAILRDRQPDIVGLSEMWVGKEREHIRESLADVYPYSIDGPHEDDVGAPIVDVEIMGGGLLMFSRYPIVATHQTVYRQCSGDDCLTNKGVLHAQIQRPGDPCGVDVYLTHMQAKDPTIGGSSEAARAAVEAQIRHLAAFISGTRDIVEPAMLFGDFNVDSFAHADLYAYLLSMLERPIDLAPVEEDVAGAAHPTGTSESDDGDISSFHAKHSSRGKNDSHRFGETTERLDYFFSFPGLLYDQRVASTRVVVEQWTDGRDMSDHYGIEARIDQTTQHFHEEQSILNVTVHIESVFCLRTTSGPGNDEVVFSISALADAGQQVVLELPEINDVEDGFQEDFDDKTIVLADPGDCLELIVSGLEKDDLSADDSLGITELTFERDELLALRSGSALRCGFPLLTGDGSEYLVQIRISAE
jgi:endonuclease/exonuclease/phosphatase family metal-dependent hydrolase